MASEVSICNLALGHLGDEATVASIDPPEGSAQAEHCETFYPIARNTVLESHAWGFATCRKALVQLADVEDPLGAWAFVYQRPNSCLKPLAVLSPGVSDDTKSEDFRCEILEDGTQVIYTNTEDAVLRFVVLVEDTTKYPALVVNAIARLLAAYLAGPVIKGETGLRVSAGQLKWYKDVDLPMAAASDANGRKIEPYKNFTPDGINARR